MFEEELDVIQNPEIKEIAIKILENVPEYFYHIPASSRGKYHPRYALGEGGLYRHVRAAIKIARHIMSLEQCEFTQDEKDMIVVALMAHDGWKQGENATGNTVHEHPILAANKVLEFSSPEDKSKYSYSIANTISSHMGMWNTSKYSDIILPKPKTEMAKFVHMVDYLASRKDIEILL